VGIACSKQQNTEKNADEILRQVEHRYRTMKTYELEAVLNSTIKSAGKNQNSSFPIYYAHEDPGKLRIEVQSNQLAMTIVSDGNTTWTYLPSSGQYKEQRSSIMQSAKDASGSVSSSSDFTDMGEQLTETYKVITKNLKKAVVLGTETVTMADGSKKKAYKVKATYDQGSGLKDMKVSPTTYLIDKKTYLVLRQSLKVSATEDSPRSPLTMYQTVNLKEAHLSPVFADSVFRFIPPSSAQKVKQFAFESQQNNSYDLVGKKAKNFDLTSFKGKEMSLKDLRGKVVVLDFWATWCGPCREAHPHIQKLYDKYKNDGLVVLGINSESKKKVQHYMNENGYTFTNLMDSNQSVSIDYQVNAIPSVFVINRKGVVASHLVGYQPESALRKAIKKAGL